MHIDWWTLALQCVNVLVLVWILARFFFRPVAAIIAQRQEAAHRLLAEAETARAEAAKVRAESDAARKQIEVTRTELAASARKAAELEAGKVLAKASAQAATLRADADVQIKNDATAAEGQIFTHASALSIDIARRLLGQLPAEATLGAFAQGLAAQLRDLPPESRELLRGGELVIASASALGDESRNKVRAAIEDALGSPAKVAFETDPGLIAGLELRSRAVLIRHSWRAALERIREEIGP
jgi:F-type H+-transporting ATPase subunit b